MTCKLGSTTTVLFAYISGQQKTLVRQPLHVAEIVVARDKCSVPSLNTQRPPVKVKTNADAVGKQLNDTAKTVSCLPSSCLHKLRVIRHACF